ADHQRERRRAAHYALGARRVEGREQVASGRVGDLGPGVLLEAQHQAVAARGLRRRRVLRLLRDRRGLQRLCRRRLGGRRLRLGRRGDLGAGRGGGRRDDGLRGRRRGLLLDGFRRLRRRFLGRALRRGDELRQRALVALLVQDGA